MISCWTVGADASIFPSSLLEKGTPAVASVGRLVDAQGVEIPIEATKDMEIALRDMTGRVILLRETVAISDRVSQPILSFGKMLENGLMAANKCLFIAQQARQFP